MKLLIDMNLPPGWVRFLQQEGFEALHWSTTGEPKATDATIMEWARQAGHVVFTHDLDFSALLALTEATGPSIIQVRTQDVLPGAIGGDVVRILRTHATELEQGAIISIDKVRSRVRILRPETPRSAGIDHGRHSRDQSMWISFSGWQRKYRRDLSRTSLLPARAHPALTSRTWSRRPCRSISTGTPVART